jgi:hypothetical protein
MSDAVQQSSDSSATRPSDLPPEKDLGGGLQSAAPLLSDVPDGGWRAYLVVLGSALTLFASFGVVNSYGVFEDYYESNRLTEENNSVVALIGAIQLFLLYGLGPLFGKIFDSYGITVSTGEETAR